MEKPKGIPHKDAQLRFFLGVAQMITAAVTAMTLVSGAPLAIVIGLGILSAGLTAISIARWGGFWKGRI